MPSLAIWLGESAGGCASIVMAAHSTVIAGLVAANLERLAGRVLRYGRTDE